VIDFIVKLFVEIIQVKKLIVQKMSSRRVQAYESSRFTHNDRGICI